MRTPWIFAHVVSLLAACGGSTPQTGQKPLPVRPTFDIQQDWTVRSTHCNGEPRKVEPNVRYKLDADHLVIVEKLEDNSELCKRAYVYARTIRSFQVDGETYSEEASLNGSQGKTTCWQKVNGKVRNQTPTTVETFDFGPARADLHLEFAQDRLALTFPASDTCPDGALVLELSPAQ